MGAGSAFAQGWQEVKGNHFIVLFEARQSPDAANAILRAAEGYYDKIARRLGYSRYSGWAWEQRVKILVFKDQQTFMSKTGQPPWSSGYSDRDSELFQSRVIVTYQQESGFLKGLLPHEIGHLILRDDVGFDKLLPLWFEEGVAQLEEMYKTENSKKLMKKLIRKNQYIPLAALSSWDVRQEQDPEKAALFYAESVSIVDFLMSSRGSAVFADLFRRLKDGLSFEDALMSAYKQQFKSTSGLEEGWINYLKNL